MTPDYGSFYWLSCWGLTSCLVKGTIYLKHAGFVGRGSYWYPLHPVNPALVFEDPKGPNISRVGVPSAIGADFCHSAVDSVKLHDFFAFCGQNITTFFLIHLSSHYT